MSMSIRITSFSVFTVILVNIVIIENADCQGKNLSGLFRLAGLDRLDRLISFRSLRSCGRFTRFIRFIEFIGFIEFVEFHQFRELLERSLFPVRDSILRTTALQHLITAALKLG